MPSAPRESVAGANRSQRQMEWASELALRKKSSKARPLHVTKNQVASLGKLGGTADTHHSSQYNCIGRLMFFYGTK